MRRLLPGRIELFVFLTAALLCAAIAHLLPKVDLGMSGMVIPLFIGAALMGMRRNARLAERSVVPPSANVEPSERAQR